MSTRTFAGTLVGLACLLAANATASAEGTGPIGLSKISPPWYIAHRGEPLVYPEHTMEAYRASVADGARFVEVDCFLLMDGSLGIMHDEYLGRTTNSHWPTARMNRQLWKSLEVVGEKLTPMQKGRFRVPMFEEVLREFGNKVVIVVEAKNPGAGPAIVSLLKQYQIAPDFVMVNSFSASELTPAKEVGYTTIFNLWSETQATDTRKLAAMGHEYFSVPLSFSEETVRSMVNAGLKVIVATLQQHSLRDRLLKLGVHGFYTDDARYMEGGRGEVPLEVSDPYASQTWFRGQIPTRPGRMGYFAPPDRWGLYEANADAYGGCLQGWCSPINNGKPFTELSISLSLVYGKATSADRWAGVLLSADDKLLINDSAAPPGFSGYHFIFRRNGMLNIYEYEAGVGPRLAAEYKTDPVETGQTIQLTISYKNNWVNFGRAGHPGTAKLYDPRFAFPYLFLGAKGIGVEFFDVRVGAR